jgi:hypothetical protein
VAAMSAISVCRCRFGSFGQASPPAECRTEFTGALCRSGALLQHGIANLKKEEDEE